MLYKIDKCIAGFLMNPQMWLEESCIPTVILKQHTCMILKSNRFNCYNSCYSNLSSTRNLFHLSYAM